MRPLKEIIDQFVSEGVMVSDNWCDFASPPVIDNKKMEESEWWLFQRLGG